MFYTSDKNLISFRKKKTDIRYWFLKTGPHSKNSLTKKTKYQWKTVIFPVKLYVNYICGALSKTEKHWAKMRSRNHHMIPKLKNILANLWKVTPQVYNIPQPITQTCEKSCVLFQLCKFSCAVYSIRNFIRQTQFKYLNSDNVAVI